MILDGLKKDRGINYLYSDKFVTNSCSLEFSIDNDLKSYVIARLFELLSDHDNDVLGSKVDRVRINKKNYSSTENFYVSSYGKQLFVGFEFIFLDKNAVFDDYYEDYFNVVKNSFYDVSINEEQLNYAKKQALIYFKGVLGNNKRKLNDEFYKYELKNSTYTKLYVADIDNIISIINSITVADMKNFYEKIKNGVNFFGGYVFGNISDSEYQTIRYIFPFESKVNSLDYDENIEFSYEDKEIINEYDLDSTINICYKYDGKNEYFNSLFSSIMNGGDGLLQKFLREKNNIVYSSGISTNIRTNFSYIYGDIDKDNKELFEKIIDEVFIIMKDENIILNAIRKEKEHALESLDEFGEDRRNIITCLHDSVMLPDKKPFLEEYLEYLNNVTPSEVIEEMNKFSKLNTIFYKGVKK